MQNTECFLPNFYFLSTGYCGTRFHYHVLRLATNAEVWHQPGHEDIAEITNLMEQRFEEDRDGFLAAELDAFPHLQRRIDKRLALPWIYGDTLNWMRGLGHMLYKHIGPERLRLVELRRHPLATCRSMLADGRQSAPVKFSDILLAEEIARRWVRQYACIRYQIEAINNPQVCQTIRLEDTSLEQIRNLYDFLELEGFDKTAVATLLNTTTKEVRHSHREGAQAPASQEELRAIWHICAPLAKEFGYVEDERFYDEAPNRPPTRHTTATEHGYDDNSRSTTFKLFDHRGLGLIIRCPSGVQYINQAGGPICFWLYTEGAFVPLAAAGPGSPGQQLFDHFHLRLDKTFMSGIGDADADFIDALLAEHGLSFISVNRSRIGEAWDLFAWQTWEGLDSAPWEAWAPVHVRHTPYSRISGVLSSLDADEAILVWENSN